MRFMFTKDLSVRGGFDLSAPKIALPAVHQDFVRRFDLELGWKDVLESKASSLLGFLGVFLAVLVSILSLRPEERLEILPLLAHPLLLQVVAALLLFIVIFGYTVSVGPSIPEVFGERHEEEDRIIAGLAAAYGTSMLRNRSHLSKKVLWYQIAVLLVSTSLIQLGLNIVLLSFPWRDYPLLSAYAWPTWAPGSLFAGLATGLLIRDFRRLRAQQNEELIKWRAILGATEGSNGRTNREEETS